MENFTGMAGLPSYVSMVGAIGIRMACFIGKTVLLLSIRMADSIGTGTARLLMSGSGRDIVNQVPPGGQMKLELYRLIESLLEAGGKFENSRYVVRNSNRELHRDDGPAIIYPDGRQYWYRNGEFHREDGPAIVFPDGGQYWYRNGYLHRDDGPAVIYPDGEQLWYRNGQRIYQI